MQILRKNLQVKQNIHLNKCFAINFDQFGENEILTDHHSPADFRFHFFLFLKE